jgi:hypothetical protein
MVYIERLPDFDPAIEWCRTNLGYCFYLKIMRYCRYFVAYHVFFAAKIGYASKSEQGGKIAGAIIAHLEAEIGDLRLQNRSFRI